jgi:hypothetical protein
MAIYRNIQMTFWTDTKIIDDFTPEDKYFYLYLFTNPHTNLAGCYEISIKLVAYETGYSTDTIERLLLRFSEVHKVCEYSLETKEILLLNWHKYNWSKSEKTLKGVEAVANHIKCDAFKEYVFGVVNGIRTDTPYIPHTYPIQASDTVTDINNIDITNNYINSNSNTTNNSKPYSLDNHSNIENLEYVIKENSLIVDFDIHSLLVDWLEYKDERKPKSANHYNTQRGIKTLISTFLNNKKEYGLEAVRHAVENSIANNYQGIVWEKAQQFRNGKGNYTYKPQQTSTDLDPQITAQLRALEEQQMASMPDVANMSDEDIDKMIRGEL